MYKKLYLKYKKKYLDLKNIQNGRKKWKKTNQIDKLKKLEKFSDQSLIGGRQNNEFLLKFKKMRNMKLYKTENINIKKLSSIYKLFFNFEGDDDVEFLSAKKVGGASQQPRNESPQQTLANMEVTIDPNSLEMVEQIRTELFSPFITDPESYDHIKELIKSNWTPERILSSQHNLCQQTKDSTLHPLILTRAGVSIGFGLRLIGRPIITHGLRSQNHNNKSGHCIRMSNPDEIFGDSDCRFVVQLDGMPDPVLIKPQNLRSTVPPIDLNILEVMSGNGEAAATFIHVLRQAENTISGYKSTDITTSPVRQDLDLGYNNRVPVFSFEECDTIDAVIRHGARSNTLLMISPPPFKNIESEEDITGTELVGYGDFYACHEYIKQTQEMGGNPEKYIIIIGELGVSDGTTGIYRYLTENPNLNLIYKNRILFETNPRFGAVIKEVYIFKIQFP